MANFQRDIEPSFGVFCFVFPRTQMLTLIWYVEACTRLINASLIDIHCAVAAFSLVYGCVLAISPLGARAGRSFLSSPSSIPFVIVFGSDELAALGGYYDPLNVVGAQLACDTPTTSSAHHGLRGQLGAQRGATCARPSRPKT